jgi:RimJ/RimL family protein N-acetyltransferase
VEPDDLPVFFEHQMDSEATAMAAFPSREWDAFMQHWGKILKDPATIQKTILFDGIVVGNVVSWVADGRREIGYWLGKPHWGKGIASQALRQFVDGVQFRPLHAHVAKHNVASIRVLEKCGFKVVGEDKCPSSAGGYEVEEFLMALEG